MLVPEKNRASLNNISNRNHHLAAFALTACGERDDQNERKKIRVNSEEKEMNR